MRWLALYLPHLPLEVLGRACADDLPLAIGGERILNCNPAAAAQGIRPGLKVGAARALCAALRIQARRPAAERAALERLAAWSMRCTSLVSLAPPRSLLLDVAASLRLFGGARALLGQVGEGVAALGYQGRLALAPTPLGALVLAIHQGADGPIIPDGAALRAALDPLPLAALGLRPRELDDLTAMGLRRVADLLRLPRAGLRARLGPRRVDWLERLLGEAPDPRLPFAPPAEYRGVLELPAEVELAPALVFPCRRLLAELGGLLLGRQAGVQRLDWRLGHARCPDTHLHLGAIAPLADPERWLELLRGHLERLDLPAPVRAVGLVATDLRSLNPTAGDLFPGATADASGGPALLDRLRARLGPDAVRGLALVADHRPDHAWRWAEPGELSRGIPRANRPLWLLPQPQPLTQRAGRPWLNGALDLGQERERIDTGWWDDRPVARDYFVATSRRGERLWVYRELRGRGDWYLHGRFG
ncbi:DNA polymerase Y family protein [uncultured Thiodictyon sp.]|uniref:Y-family DNA polymerase n=1 Tax=uncultured Thiodictyon sp. TaxID=1846217 RepID=UPI0025EDA23B|nr:DNA polymerase Y family protein [uncultured Thiodictyon sp.]